MRDFLLCNQNSKCHSSLRDLPRQVARRRGWTGVPNGGRSRTGSGSGSTPHALVSARSLVKTSKVRYHGRDPDKCTKNTTQKDLGGSKAGPADDRFCAEL